MQKEENNNRFVSEKNGNFYEETCKIMISPKTISLKKRPDLWKM